MDTQEILKVTDLKKYYPVYRGFRRRVAGHVRAVDGVSFKVDAGETLSLVGESGAGKTTVAKMILRQEPLTSGEILFQGRDIYKLSPEQFKAEYRPRVQVVPQDPYSSLDPRVRVGEAIAEPLVVNTHVPKEARHKRVLELLDMVGLAPELAKNYPHEFSGGQRQRIAVARALALSPALVILDEPVSALDVSIGAQVMNLLKDLQKDLHLTYLLIAHNLATVAYLSHHVAIMYLGEIVEYGPTQAVFYNPLHPYTKALISASVLAQADGGKGTIVLQGEMPSPLKPPSGCRFHTRCFQCEDDCSKLVPELREVEGRLVRCHGC
jgi:oligopeptide/dipeptide ABC transporter ATP-binding protein